MLEKVYGILQEYEEYISNAKDQKKVSKKKANELTKLAELNEKHGIETDSIILSLDEIKTEVNNLDKEIAKGKKIIYRLNVCMNILEDKPVNETETME